MVIGIVVVSHSRALGEAVVALAREMAGSSVTPSLAVAAGLDETTFGTDAAAVAAAVEEVVSSAEGVLVLVDIGSSVLSAEMACELVDPEIAERVRISAAPLVEGILPAVVAAAGGADLDEVAREAEEGLLAKREHLGAGFDTQPRSSAAAQPAVSAPAVTRPAASAEITIGDPHGLHARPAAKLVTLVRSFDAQVAIANLDTDGRPVPADSLSSVATLNAGPGARLRLTAEGPQAAEALDAVRELAARDFTDASQPEKGTEDAVPAPSSPNGSGLDAALGAAHVLRVGVDLDAYEAGSVSEEKARSDRAVRAVTDDIRSRQGGGGEARDILAAHLALLDDPTLRADVAAELDRGVAAPAAWRGVLDRLAARFGQLADPYQRARAQDVRGIERQLLRALTKPDSALAQEDSIPAGSILVVDELDPSTAAALDAGVLGGVVTVRGGDTGHGAIVARSRGIPLFTDGGEPAEGILDGQTVGFDATTRTLAIDPDRAELGRLQSLLEHRRDELRAAAQRAKEPATTQDGVHIPVRANITSPHDALAAGAIGADGSGLVRTEIVFGTEQAVPSASKQGATFLSIASALHWQPVTIRTWDVGGDKPLPFLPPAAGATEENPMLGARGLRLMRQHPEVFDEQLVGVCAAAESRDIRVMFPMVTTRDEVDWALERLATAQRMSGVDRVPVGIMVEVPAAALRVAELAKGIDFVSIGTNDLAQYTLATDRGNATVGDIADGLDPAVLQLIRHVVDHAPAGVEVAVCGDLASRPEAVPLLLGLGVQELSVAGPVLPRIKQAVRHTSLAAARELARQALDAPSAAAVRDLLARAGT